VSAISQAVHSILFSPFATLKVKILENWTGNLNYWTGGKQGCKGSWGWCSGAQSQPFSSNLSWAWNQPECAKEKENCLHMRVFQNKSGVLLSDRECKDKYIFACKVGNFFIKLMYKNIGKFAGKNYFNHPSSNRSTWISNKLQAECILFYNFKKLALKIFL